MTLVFIELYWLVSKNQLFLWSKNRLVEIWISFVWVRFLICVWKCVKAWWVRTCCWFAPYFVCLQTSGCTRDLKKLRAIPLSFIDLFLPLKGTVNFSVVDTVSHQFSSNTWISWEGCQSYFCTTQLVTHIFRWGCSPFVLRNTALLQLVWGWVLLRFALVFAPSYITSTVCDASHLSASCF